MFSDVDQSSYAKGAIEWAQKNGIINGFEDGTFRPYEPVTREQMAVLLYRQSLQDGTFKDILPIIKPSTVMLSVGTGVGSGVVFKDSPAFSYILTNAHVAKMGPSLLVTPYDGDARFAVVEKVDIKLDLAVLRCPPGLKACTLAAYSASVGQPVCVVGSPQGFDQSVSVGIVSNEWREQGKWFQTDAHINPGNSGGGLFNELGELVGLSVAKMSDPLIDGMGFAIRLDKIKEFLVGY